MQDEGAELRLHAEALQKASSADHLAAVEATAVGLRDLRVLAQGQAADPGLLGGQLAVEDGQVAAALPVEGLGLRHLAQRLGGPSLPVEGASLGDRRDAGGGQPGEVGLGGGRVAEFGQGQPARVELGLGGVGAGAHAAVAGDVVGRLVVAPLQSGDDHPPLVGPASGSGVRGRRGLHPLRQGEGQGGLSALVSVQRLLPDHARMAALLVAQGGDQGAGVASARAQGHAGFGQGLVRAGEDGDQLQRGRTLRSPHQKIGAGGVLRLADVAAEALPHGDLLVDLEELGGPPALDQGPGLRLIAGRFQGGGHGHGARGRGRLGAAEPVDDLAGRQVAGFQQPLGRRLPTLRARPAGQVAPRRVGLEEAHRLRRPVGQGPDGDLAGQRIVDTADGGAHLRPIAGLGGGKGHLQVLGVAIAGQFVAGQGGRGQSDRGLGQRRTGHAERQDRAAAGQPDRPCADPQRNPSGTITTRAHCEATGRLILSAPNP